MRFSTLVSGWYFCDLLAHGKEIDKVISQGDNRLLQHSTPELERWFAKPPAELPRQNGFPLAFVLFFFLLAFAGALLTLLTLLPDLTSPVRALLFFLPGLLFIFSNLTASYLIARGKTSGLTWYGHVHSILTVLSAVLLVVTMLEGMTHHAVIMLVALLIMLACRYVLNGRGFILFVLYARTQRIAALSRGMRQK
jgi:O-antigen/teichoic acid export membrane protein